MWPGIALIVWLWGVALYLVAYYAALAIWGAQRLYEALGESFYNEHIPQGGWRPALLATIVFAIVFALVSLAQRPIARGALALERRFRVARWAGNSALHTLLIGVCAPTIAFAADSTWEEIQRRIDRVAAEQAWAEAERLELAARARDPFFLGAHGSVVEFRPGGKVGRGTQILLTEDGTYRRFFFGCGNARPEEGCFRTDGRWIVLEPPPSDFAGLAQHDERWLDVRWGARRYLVHELEVDGFCEAAEAALANGSEESLRWFLLRVDDRDATRNGVPGLPAPWNARFEQR